MRALIIGAGAVGQVYAWYLQRGGAEVGALVKPKYAAETRAGFVMHRLSMVRGPRTHRLDDLEVIEAVDAIDESWDQIWICISSPAARGEWIEEFARRSGSATIIAMLPTHEDREYLRARIAEERLVLGVIPFLSFPAPLGSLQVPSPGTAYWLPPAMPTQLSGQRAASVVASLRKGGCPARAIKDVVGLSSFGAALLMPHLAGLESRDWSFAQYRSSPELARAHAAAKCALRVVAAELGSSPPFWARIGPGWMRLLLWAAPMTVPIDLEAYVRFHFTKVREQTQLFLLSYRERGKQRGIETSALEPLLGA